MHGICFSPVPGIMLTASSSSSSPNCPICNPALRQTRNRGMEIDSAGDAHTVPSPPAQRASDQLGAIGAQFEERDGSTPNPECCTQCEAVGYRCTRLESEVGCVRCKDLETACSFEQMPSNKASKPRVLNRIKCDFCRSSKQKCLPTHRHWSDLNRVKCERCIAKNLPCSKPTKTADIRQPTLFNLSDIESSAAGVLDNQMRPTISRPSTPLHRNPLPPKKRGRPSKADVETRMAEAIARGDVLSSPKPPAKRARPVTGEFTTEGVANQVVSESDRRDSNPDDTLLERQFLNEGGITQAGQLQSPIMNVPSTTITSPPPISTSAGAVKIIPSTSGQAAMSSLSRKRARANWFLAAERVKRRNQLEKITEYLMEISRGVTRVLCPVCSSMNLSPDKFIIPTHDQAHKVQEHARTSEKQCLNNSNASENYNLGPSKRGKLMLGSLTEIRERSHRCPFCKLVLQAAQEQTEKDLSEEPANSLICCASWQVDGHEFDESRLSTTARTRRIRLHWNGGDFQDSYIVLLGDSNEKAKDALFLGRRVGRDVDIIGLMRTWLNLCEEHHQPTCGIQSRDHFEDMRSRPYFGVVDVVDMKLTSLPPGSRYIALSYTWPDSSHPTRFTTKKGHVTSLQLPNGLDGYIKYFPRAIRDSFDLLRHLGERYLWVDSICIVQDSKDSLELNLKMMDQVYGNAYFTICAADDPDATAGLVALHPESRHASQFIEQYAPGVRLMVSQLTESYIRKSKWNTRAWTFQERLLSRRCAIFSRGQVFFQCRRAAMSEDIWSESPTTGWSIGLAKSPQQVFSILPVRPLQVYGRLVEMYTPRVLDFKDDILAAFSGISNMLGTAMKTNFVYGLPDEFFDWALLWDSRHFQRRRLERRKRDSNGRKLEPMFPSWSWCGWLGTMHYKHALSSLSLHPLEMQWWFLHHTWIVWYVRDCWGRLRLIQQPSRSVQSNVDNNFAGPGMSTPGQSKPLDMYGREMHYPDRDGTTFYRTLPDFPYSIGKADPDEKRDLLRQDLRFLQFWTWSAQLYVSFDDSHDKPKPSHELRRFGILDSKGDWCGSILLRQDWEKKIDDQHVQEFLAISDAKEFSAEEYDYWNYYIPVEKEYSSWDLYYVLMIERDKEGIARRSGLGKVFKEAFSYSCGREKAWDEIILG